MRNLRFRTKLAVSFWGMLIIALCLPAYYLYQTLEQEILEEARAHSFTQLQLVSWLLQKSEPFEDVRALDHWCKELGKRSRYRITLISSAGRVIADSDVLFEEIQQLDSHADRPEVVGARKQEKASSIRYSTTLKRKLIYAAQKISLPHVPAAVLRVAIPLSTVQARMAYFANRFWMILAGFFLFAAALSFFLAKKLETPIRKIIETAGSIGEGNYQERVDIESGPEFSRLAACINEMAGRIQQHINKISRQARELEAVFEGMQEGVMLLDENGRIKAANEALSLLAKCKPSCTGRRPMEIFLNPEIQTACEEVLGGKPYLRLTVGMDNRSVYEINLVRIPDGGAVVVFHDISELVRLERVRRDFVANVSHELRTPLTSIKGYAETLINKGFNADDTAARFLQTIHKNATQMSNIVNDLLELTRLETVKQNPADLKPINAFSCLSMAWETCLPLARAKNIELINPLSDVPKVQAEENALVLVFRNLLENAVRYSPENTRIHVFAKDQPDQVVFAVQDEGPGIAREHQERIFERFYRVDKERSRASGGTGLGLSICRHAVLGMGGRIWVQSPPDGAQKGTVFYFFLKKA